MCTEVPAVNKYYVLSRVRTLTTRSHLAVAAVAIAFGTLTSCNNDSNPNLPAIVPLPNSIAVADLNGTLDLLVATTADEGLAQNPGYADVIMNNPPGVFQTGIHYATTGTNPSSIAVADLTGANGPVDIVIANFGSGSVSVFMHGATTGTTFNAAVDVPTGGQPNQVVIADINGDGKPDLVLADMSASGNVIVLQGDGTGKFGAPKSLPTGLTTTSVAVADLTGKGGPPAIVAATYDSSGNNGAVYIFYQDPNGTFGTPKVFPAGPQPQSVKIADLGNGLPDIIVANLGPGADGKGSAGVSVLMQNSDGTFTAPVTYPTPGQSIDVAVGDLTGAGKMDLVVANLLPSNTGSISVLLHDTNPGTFGARTDHIALGQPLSVVIRDLNNDGRADIAVADGPSAGVLLQNADGTFPPEETQVGY
jgi:hypothetical protein